MIKSLAFIMAMGIVVLCLIIGLGLNIDARNVKEKELKLLHVIFRHGIRTPADTYPNDPYINDTFAPAGWGQLTNEGKLQMYEIGQYLRKRYNDYLGTQYNPNAYYTETTDVDRTKMSGQLINAGLWPPKGTQVWGPLDWQPIPIHATPLNVDSLLLVRRPCAKYHIEFNKLLETPEIKKIFKENKQLFDDLTKITGKTVTNPDDVQDIYSTLKAEDSFHMTLPEWTKNYYPDKLLPMTEFSYILNAYNDKLNRLKGGVLLKKLIHDWTSKRDNSISPKERKTFMYGGHDSTISNILSTLKVWESQVPGYGITILFELLLDHKTNQYGVEIYLRNDTNVEPYKLTIPQCEEFCPLDKLVKLTVPVIPVNWDEECKTDDPEFVPPPPGGP